MRSLAHQFRNIGIVGARTIGEGTRMKEITCGHNGRARSLLDSRAGTHAVRLLSAARRIIIRKSREYLFSCNFHCSLHIGSYLSVSPFANFFEGARANTFLFLLFEINHPSILSVCVEHIDLIRSICYEI